ncbi:MAG: HNH endonuclease [Bryobacteraceae bacterium]|nr:HNH endonuclease [Bryobacteraceae bacterium]
MHRTRRSAKVWALTKERWKHPTVGELLHWSYANLAMAHAAVDAGARKYGPVHFMIRGRLYAGLNSGAMQIGPLAADDRLKMLLPQACCYCGSRHQLSADHLMPTKRGGPNTGDNLVWACRSCNSSKGARDVLEWLGTTDKFPPLLLLRRYLKLAVELCRERQLMQLLVTDAPALPFVLTAIPRRYPAPNELKLWIGSLPDNVAGKSACV